LKPFKIRGFYFFFLFFLLFRKRDKEMDYLAKAKAILASSRAKLNSFGEDPCAVAKEAKEVPENSISGGSRPLLSKLRWGPSSLDASPGIVFDTPNPTRRRAAVLSFGPGPGDAFVGPLETWTAPIVGPPMIQPGSDEEFLTAIRDAGFIAIDPESARAPAWVADDLLTVTMGELALSIGFHTETTAHENRSRPRSS
jgi:hypothetical protein